MTTSWNDEGLNIRQLFIAMLFLHQAPPTVPNEKSYVHTCPGCKQETGYSSEPIQIMPELRCLARYCTYGEQFYCNLNFDDNDSLSDSSIDEDECTEYD